MPADGALLNRVQDALADLREVEQKKMFGGITFMVRGKMCVTVGGDRIMCRIDPAIHDAAVARKGARTVFMKGREYRGLIYVDAAAIRSKRDLSYWLGLALDFNSAAKSATGKKGRS